MAKKSDTKKTTIVDQKRPFLGLRSFEEKNKSQFGGRDKEISELFDLVEDNNLTVVFGTSGIGKTSLLKAGLMPKLREEVYFPIYIRIDYSSSKTPLNQLRDHVYKTIKKTDPSVIAMEHDTVWEYLHEVKLLNGILTPVLILDQFEEIYTLGKHNKGVKEFIKELANLSQNRIPRSIKEKYIKQSLSVPARFNKLKYRIVLSLREDYLARLDELKNFIPVIMDYGFRVVQMTIAQAMEAAIKPGKGLINESVAKEIIKLLPGVSQADFDAFNQEENKNKLKVEPFLLSLICDRLNEKRIEKGEKTITEKLVGKFKVEDVISSFYNDTIKKLNPKVDKAIQEKLLDNEGYRKLYSLKEFQNEYDITNDVVNELIIARIVRKESRNNVDYLELIHDVLAPVIKKKRSHRIEEEKERKQLKKLRMTKAKNRRRYIRIGGVLGILLIGLFIISIVKSAEVQENKEQKDRKLRSREILLSAISLSIYTHENKDVGYSALLSRLAYGLYNQDRENISGVNEVDWKFYHGLMKSNFKNELKSNLQLYSVGSTFRLKIKHKPDSVKEVQNNIIYDEHRMTPTHLSRVDHQGAYLVAFRDSTFRKLALNDSIKIMKMPIYQNFNEGSVKGISAMAYDSKDKQLAIAQYRTIYIYDEDDKLQQPIIKIPDTTNSKYTSSFFMKYTPEGSIVLARGDKLYRWDSTYTKPVSWSNLKIKKWGIMQGDLTIFKKNTTSNIDSTNIKQNSDISKKPISLKPKSKNSTKRKPPFELKIKPSSISLSFHKSKSTRKKLRIKALSVSHNSLIAIGIKDRLIIIDKNIVHEIKFSKWGEITALSFDPTGKFLVLGDKFGVVYHIDIPSNRDFEGIVLTKHIAHSKKILDISFSPKDSITIATASQDGSVAIWNKSTIKLNDNSILNSLGIGKKDEKEIWSALLLDASLFGVSGPAMKISFSIKGGYLLVVYEKGNTIKWPSSLEKINKLICEKSEKKEFRKDLTTIYKDELDIVESDKGYYYCECIN